MLVIIHSDEGSCIGSKSIYLGQCTNNKAELLSLIEGLNLCKKLKISKLEIEGDSAIIVNAMRTRTMPNWELRSLLDRALFLMESCSDYTTNHIYREANTLADNLANIGADGTNKTTSLISRHSEQVTLGHAGVSKA